MPPPRTSDSGARWEPYKHSHHAPSLKPTPPTKPKQKRHTHTADEWDALRPVIEQIYIEDDRTVDQVIDILKTKHNFVVGKRKLLEWMKSQAIAKNESKTNMRILYAKRQSRLILEGKKTIITKDGRILDDDRLDRWGAKFSATLHLDDYITAATPKHYTIATPAATASHSRIDSHEYKALEDLFTANKLVQVAYGFVLDKLDNSEPNTRHEHQIGVLGLHILSEVSQNYLHLLLQQSLVLAQDLITVLLSPSSQTNEHYASMRPKPNTRVPKVHICYTGYPPNGMWSFSESRIVTTLQSSKTCMQLLQLSPGDCTRWQRDWYAMTHEEQSVYNNLCTKFFGSLSSFDIAMSYMHIVILLESPNEPTETVLTRISLGVDMRPAPECEICHRRVALVDSMNEKGAVKLNVPLQSAWQGNWEPDNLWAVQGSDTARWEDYVYAFRAWFLERTRCSGNMEGDAELDEGDERSWDPMGTDDPSAAFQPRETTVPMGCCTYNDVGFVCQCSSDIQENFGFNPANAEDVHWDPHGLHTATADDTSDVLQTNELMYLDS